MGTRHDKKHIMNVWACGLPCYRETGKATVFELKAINQRWCRCPICTRERQQYELEKKRAWEKTRRRPGRSKVDRERQIALQEKANMKAGWKHCIKCGTLTPNHFGHCSTCLEYFSTKYDLDAIVTWHSGPAIHRRGTGTVCRVGGGTI